MNYPNEATKKLDEATMYVLTVKSMCHVIGNIDNWNECDRESIDLCAVMETCEELMESVYQFLSYINLKGVE